SRVPDTPAHRTLRAVSPQPRRMTLIRGAANIRRAADRAESTDCCFFDSRSREEGLANINGRSYADLRQTGFEPGVGRSATAIAQIEQERHGGGELRIAAQIGQ